MSKQATARKAKSIRATAHELVRAGLDNDAIYRVLRRRGLPPERRYYVAWYRAEVARRDRRPVPRHVVAPLA